MAKATELTYEVTQELGNLNENGTVRLNVASWNGRPAKIDIRNFWKDKETGEMKPGKGISLTNDEAKVLVDLLTEYMAEDDDDDI